MTNEEGWLDRTRKRYAMYRERRLAKEQREYSDQATEEQIRLQQRLDTAENLLRRIYRQIPEVPSVDSWIEEYFEGETKRPKRLQKDD